MKRRFFAFLSVSTFILLSNLSYVNAQSSDLIEIGEDDAGKTYFLDKKTVERTVAGGEERFFEILTRYGNGLEIQKYRGSCSSSATLLREILIADSSGSVLERKRFSLGWKYPEKGSILRNALQKSCRLT